MSFEEYRWSEEEKSVVTGLGLVWWGGSPVNFRGYVWIAHDADENYYVAKAIPKGSREIQVLQMMLSLPSPRNRIIPGRLYECQHSYVFLMPRLQPLGYGIWARAMTWDTMLDQFYIMIDYVQFMQEHNVAYVDVSLENTVWAIKPVSYGGFDIPVDQVYFIDYGTARIMPSGPGSGAKIYDYDEDGGKYTPTEATDAMDPYAYDILALGYTFENGFLWYRDIHTPGRPTHIPRSWAHFAASLRAEDPLQPWMYKFSQKFADNFGYYGWRIISPLIR